MNKIAIHVKKIVSILLPVFLYWIKLSIVKPNDVIKNHIAGISPSIEPINLPF